MCWKLNQSIFNSLCVNHLSGIETPWKSNTIVSKVLDWGIWEVGEPEVDRGSTGVAQDSASTSLPIGCSLIASIIINRERWFPWILLLSRYCKASATMSLPDRSVSTSEWSMNQEVIVKCGLILGTSNRVGWNCSTFSQCHQKIRDFSAKKLVLELF